MYRVRRSSTPLSVVKCHAEHKEAEDPGVLFGNTAQQIKHHCIWWISARQLSSKIFIFFLIKRLDLDFSLNPPVLSRWCISRRALYLAGLFIVRRIVTIHCKFVHILIMWWDASACNSVHSIKYFPLHQYLYFMLVHTSTSLHFKFINHINTWTSAVTTCTFLQMLGCWKLVMKWGMKW